MWGRDIILNTLHVWSQAKYPYNYKKYVFCLCYRFPDHIWFWPPKNFFDTFVGSLKKFLCLTSLLSWTDYTHFGTAPTENYERGQ